MSVTLIRAYGTFAAGALVTLPSSTEAALIAQGLATAANASSTGNELPGEIQSYILGGNASLGSASGIGVPAVPQGPSMVPNCPLGGTALTAFDTNGRVHVAGTMNLAEVFVPRVMSATGIGFLNGTVVGTDNMLVALYDSNGVLLANSAVAGVLSAGASAFQNVSFTAPITLLPGRYFLGVQCNGTTATTRRLLSTVQPNVLTTSVAGTFGTIPASITVPTTHTTAVGVIAQLFT